MTPTTNTIRENQSSVGIYALAYGISDELFVAVSPWIWSSYNTANIHFKWVPYHEQQSKIGFFLSYFESYNSKPMNSIVSGSAGISNSNASSETISLGSYRYQWKSSSFHMLYSDQYFTNTKTYFSAKYSYFWNDDLAYSIRMDPGRDSIHDQFDLTSLNAFHLGKSNYIFNYELGVLGLNYMRPYLHTGVSFSYVSRNWLLQLGASYTVQFAEAGKSSGWTPGRFDSRVHQSQSTGQFYYFRYLQTALHPEIQIQYYF